ncbi:MAG TPA: prepilin-type N-terminal cleavage/methylation domain-containing protein [Acidimicrobiia bacterium]|jgi:general secretion pathway protein G|nr:prepilin-type N-terminal cleavage/methylation domain-containing protein [Acidimicrobiia bacterium]
MYESLRKIRDRRETGEGGFTLVELLIVIVILGILAAIVVLAIGGLKGSSQNAACTAGAHTIESAEDAYFASVTPNAYGSSAQLLGAGLLKAAPTDLTAAATGGGNGYSITATGGGNCTATPGFPITYTAP